MVQPKQGKKGIFPKPYYIIYIIASNPIVLIAYPGPAARTPGSLMEDNVFFLQDIRGWYAPSYCPNVLRFRWYVLLWIRVFLFYCFVASCGAVTVQEQRGLKTGKTLTQRFRLLKRYLHWFSSIIPAADWMGCVLPHLRLQRYKRGKPHNPQMSLIFLFPAIYPLLAKLFPLLSSFRKKVEKQKNDLPAFIKYGTLYTWKQGFRIVRWVFSAGLLTIPISPLISGFPPSGIVLLCWPRQVAIMSSISMFFPAYCLHHIKINP